MILVWRRCRAGRRYLVLRAAGAADDVDWAWRPPSGGREAGESDEECAQRELLEETGLAVPVQRVVGPSYPTFVVEVDTDCEVVLSDEHDALEWVTADELVRRCRPDIVSSGLAESLGLLGHARWP